MMNRERFLQALRERIAMLEQSEQEDILAEYAQHIEMLMKDGLSEEEAIRDFGPLDELAAEILEAYHIDPAYGAEREETGDQEEITAKEKESLLRRMGASLRAFWGRVQAAFTRLDQRIRGWFRREKAPKETCPPKEKRESLVIPACARAVGRGWNGVKRICRRLGWLGWNGGLLLCAVPVALMALVGMVSLGFLVVMTFQGLPLLGVSLMTLGGLLFLGALMCLGWSARWSWSTPCGAPEPMDPEEPGDIAEEIAAVVCEEQEETHEN